MDVSALKYFIAAAQTEHMSRAAEKLNISFWKKEFLQKLPKTP